MTDRASEQRYFLKAARYRAGGAITLRAWLAQAIAFTAVNAVSVAGNVSMHAPKTPFRFVCKALCGTRPTVCFAEPVPIPAMKKSCH